MKLESMLAGISALSNSGRTSLNMISLNMIELREDTTNHGTTKHGKLRVGEERRCSFATRGEDALFWD